MSDFIQLLTTIDDPRQSTKIKYPLVNILFISFCAIFYGAEGWHDIGLFAEYKRVSIAMETVKVLKIDRFQDDWWTYNGSEADGMSGNKRKIIYAMSGQIADLNVLEDVKTTI